MYFMFMKIIDIQYKEDILLALQSVGIETGSMIASKNIEKMLKHDITMFTGFFKSDEDKAEEQLIITSLIDTKKQATDLIKILKEADIDIEKNEILRLVVMPVSLVFDYNSGIKEYD